MVQCTCEIHDVEHISYYVQVGCAMLCAYGVVHMLDMWCCDGATYMLNMQ